ncbi:hypothetical protein LIER_20547 [Lithospermum erythrorhizon]|uniref:Uncharacterized protein n=1 Tax=Lithospermum erythrorhizon TaxID=34254 RepID=A0AAV3QQ00_LITER
MHKLHNKYSSDGFLQILNRQLGFHHHIIFPRRIYANKALVKSIDLYTKFNSTGDIIVSGSDDKENYAMGLGY